MWGKCFKGKKKHYMNKAKETEKAHDEFLQPFLHIKKKKARQIQENYLSFIIHYNKHKMSLQIVKY